MCKLSILIFNNEIQISEILINQKFMLIAFEWWPVFINLIPYNPVDDGNGFKKPIKKDMLKFKYLLEASGKKVTIRLERGADIDAACGQLAGKLKSNQY